MDQIFNPPVGMLLRTNTTTTTTTTIYKLSYASYRIKF